MVAGVRTEEFTSTVSVEKLWKAGVDDAHNLLPTLLPHVITGVEVIEGSGGPGTLKKFTFTDVVEYKSLTDRVDIYDPANHLFKHSVVEGGLLGTKLKSLVFEIKVEAAGEGGCLVKVKAEYDSIDDGFPTAEEAAKITGNVVGMIKAVEGYLLAN